MVRACKSSEGEASVKRSSIGWSSVASVRVRVARSVQLAGIIEREPSGWTKISWRTSSR